MTDTVGFVAQAAARAGRGLPLDARLGAPGRPGRPRGRRRRRRRRGPDRGRPRVLEEIGAADVPELLVINKADRAPDEAKALAARPRGRRRSPPGRARASTSCCASWPTACAGRTGWWSWSCRGRGATSWRPSTARARWSDQTRRRGVGHAAGRAGRRRPGPLRGVRRSATVDGFRLPPYPYDRLDGLAKLAEAPPGRHGRLLHRHALRPARRRPWSRPWRPRGPSGATRRRPAVRRAARGRGRLAGRGASASTIFRRTPSPPASGTKELVASVPHSCACASPTGHRALPGGLLPDLRDGRRAGGLPGRGGPAPPGRTAASTSTPIDREDAGARAGALGRTRPSNPTGGLGDLAAAAAWGRSHGVPVFSDECYAEFTWDGPPRSMLEHGTDGVRGRALALQAVEPGRRPGRLLRRRPRAGRVPPGRAPARRPHGARAGAGRRRRRPGRRRARGRQRERYLERLDYLAEVLAAARLPGDAARGRLLLWVPVPAGRWADAWAMAEALAARRRACWSARATSTATPVPATCGSPSCSRWSVSRLVGDRLAPVASAPEAGPVPAGR